MLGFPYRVGTNIVMQKSNKAMPWMLHSYCVYYYVQLVTVHSERMFVVVVGRTKDNIHLQSYHCTNTFPRRISGFD